MESSEAAEAGNPSESDGSGSSGEDETESTSFLEDTAESHVVLKVPVESESDPSQQTVNDNGTHAIDEETDSTRPEESNPSPSTFVSNPTASPGTSPGTEQVAQALPTSPPVATVAPSPNLTWSIIFVPMGVCLVIFVLLWSVVNGWFERLIY